MKKEVKNIQTAGYNCAHTLFDLQKYNIMYFPSERRHYVMFHPLGILRHHWSLFTFLFTFLFTWKVAKGLNLSLDLKLNLSLQK